jgi:heterodisulfide reductase subunit A
MNSEPRIGVFVCHCGKNIAKTVNVAEVRDYAATLPDVKFTSEQEFTCSESGQQIIKDAIKEHKLNRVVVASCSPKLHELTFRRCVSESGLNPFLFEMANLREHCSWPHLNEPIEATKKAKHIVRASVERASLLEEIGMVSVGVKPTVLVIGGGVAGIESSLALADYGFEVHLVEKEPILGGKALQLGKVFSTEDCGICTAPSTCDLHRKCMYKSPILTHPKIHTYTMSTVKNLDGYVGNFTATLSVKPRYVDLSLCISCGKCEEVCPVDVSNEFDFGLSTRKAIHLPFTQALPHSFYVDYSNCNKCGKCVEICPTKAINLDETQKEINIEVGALVVATGFEEFEPFDFFGYGKYPNVITQMKLARMIDPSGPTGGDIKGNEGNTPNDIVMIQCVGSRDVKSHPHCSKICCAMALKHARSIRERYPNTNVSIIYKDIRLAGRNYEQYYTDCEKLGVKFYQGEVLEINEGSDPKSLSLIVNDSYKGKLKMETDMVVLSTALVPSKGYQEFARTLNLSLSPDNFLMELHPKLAPVDTNVDGIYIAGACQSPKDIHESINQAMAASSRVSALLAKGEIKVDLAKSKIDEDLCIGCANCVAKCPYNAIDLTPLGVAKVIEIACKGCGVCVAECPARAIQLRHFKDEQILAAVAGILR